MMRHQPVLVCVYEKRQEGWDKGGLAFECKDAEGNGIVYMFQFSAFHCYQDCYMETNPKATLTVTDFTNLTETNRT